MKHPPLIQRKNGFTLIELILVLAILAVLAVIAIPSISKISAASKLKVDNANLITLNKTTQLYAIDNDCSNNDIFCNLNSDKQRMQALVDKELLADKLQALQNKKAFKWNITKQEWTLVGSSTTYSTNPGDGDKHIGDLIKIGKNVNKWRVNDYGGISPDVAGAEQLIFIENPNEEYEITVKATLPSTNGSGYGIFFDTSLKVTPDDKLADSGYLIQFDRGREQVMVRTRLDGKELHHKDHVLVKIKKADQWWRDEHEIKLVVTKKNSIKTLTVYVDGNLLGDAFTFESTLEGEMSYTGFRSWNATSTNF